MSKKPEIDEYTGLETTGHEWDGIKELANPTPRWWLWVFLATIIWSIGYWVIRPAWPLLADYTRGTENYSSREQVLAAVADAKAAQSSFRDSLLTMSYAEIENDAELYDFAYKGGRSAFGLHCAQCHGLGAQGAPGIANLNDDDWIWGGHIDEIEHTIRYGVRAEPVETHFSEMPRFGDGMLSDDQIAMVAASVLSGDYSAGTGGALFQEHCSTCHGPMGEGLRELGAPRLNDAIWLYGGTQEDLERQIRSPSHGMMPAWGGRLDPVMIKQLAIYVHSLGGGE